MTSRSLRAAATGTSNTFASVKVSWKSFALPLLASTTITLNSACFLPIVDTLTMAAERGGMQRGCVAHPPMEVARQTSALADRLGEVAGPVD
ncbi:hypothetical protein [Streptomyces sp. NPDC058307]|uniref:hypothetical protein n=1 Tax=Streptomyces sp. NPDC058307 TaxID=3346439 RepID=UPI0036E28D75